MARDSDKHGAVYGYSRRQWLKAAVSGSLVGLAGCSGSEDGQNDGTDGADGADGTDKTTEEDRPNIVDGTLSIPWPSANVDLPRGDLNRWGANWSGSLARILSFRPGDPSRSHDNDWYPLDIEDYEVDTSNDEIRAHLRDDLYWTQGGEVLDDFTAEDMVVMFELLRYMTPSQDRIPDEEQAVLDWHAEEDDLFVMELNPDGYNVESIVTELQSQYVTTYRDGFFGEKVEELKEATTHDAEVEIIEEISGHQHRLEDDVPLSGAYMLEEVHENEARFTLNEEHWAAKTTPESPREVEIHILGGGAEGNYQATESGTVDIMQGSIPTVVSGNAIPEHVTQVTNPSDVGTTLLVNYGGPDIDPYMGVDEERPPEERTAGAQQAKIRQAMAHAINYEHVQSNRLGERNADLVDTLDRPHPTTDVHLLEEEFPDLYEQLPSYDEADAEMAQQRLEEAGLTKEDGTWVKPDGEPLEIVLQAHGDSVDMLRTINEDLQSIGLASELETLGDEAWNRYLDNTISMGEGWINPNPVGIELRAHMVPGYGWPDTVRPGQLEIPPIGEMDSEPTQTINVIDLTQDFHRETLDDHREELRTLLWAYAYHLPEIPLFPDVASVTLNSESISWPEPMPDERVAIPSEDHDPVYGTGFYALSHPAPGINVSD